MKYSIKQILDGDSTLLNEKPAIINGWVRSNRESKAGISFITVNDGSCVINLQIIAPAQLSNYTQEITKLSKDCSITVHGQLQLSPKSELELLAEKVIVHGLVEDPGSYPISLKKHSIEHLREHAHLRIRTNLISSVMRVKNTISYAIHNYLQSQGFFWVQTPIITSSDCEGAGELFRVTTLDLNQVPKTDKNTIDYKKDFFGKEAFLTVSGQLNGEAYCLGLAKVYTFGPTFRAENSNTTRHLAEFWMIEPELAFANLADVIQLAQNLLKFVCSEVLKHNLQELEFLTKFTETDIITRINNTVDSDFASISYSEAIQLLTQSKQQFEQPVFWGCDLASEHERYLCETIMQKPTVITDYPKDIKAFYMKLNDDGKTVAAMDIIAPGIGEIVGGSQREDRLDILIQQLQDKNIDPTHLQWYLDLRKFGTTPHAGFGLGLERLVSYITNVHNVRDVIAFPRAAHALQY